MSSFLAVDAGKIVSLTTSDGHDLDGYYYPAATKPIGSLVMLHEIFGVTDFMKNSAEKWASLGFNVIIPALYDRLEKHRVYPYHTEGYQAAVASKKMVDNLSQQLLDVSAAADFLRAHGASQVGIIGYSWGATLAWLAASRRSDIAAVSAYYGVSIYQHRNEKPHCPVQCHFADQDNLVPLTDVQALAAFYPEMAIFQYPATHGFLVDRWEVGSPYQFDKSSSLLAQQRDSVFFIRYLSGTLATE